MLKFAGALMIVMSCAAVGFYAAAAHRKEEQALKQLFRGLEYMSNELQYKMTPLPELCANAAKISMGCVGKVFLALEEELNAQITPEASSCMHAAISRQSNLPCKVEKCLTELGTTLGRFDLSGQISGLEAVKKLAELELEHLSRNREVRLRNYQTLGLCAGSALALILL